MYQLRFHGRGGQGVVTAAELLSVAALLENKHAQAFPSFGSERMGAPVAAFCRLDDKPIRLRDPVTNPDALIVLDATLVRHVDLLIGIENTKIVLINTRLPIEALNAKQLQQKVDPANIITIAATEIAMELLNRNVPNVIMLSAFCAASGLISFQNLCQAVKEKFKGKVADLNIAAAERAWKLIADSGTPSPSVSTATTQPKLEVSHA
jgi:pyruvate ferredoxin oxidoreductase gamma subunit